MEFIVLLVFGILVLWMFAYMWQGVIDTLFDIDSLLLGWVASILVAVFIVWLFYAVNNHYEKKAEKLPESKRWKVLLRQTLAWFCIGMSAFALLMGYKEFKYNKEHPRYHYDVDIDVDIDVDDDVDVDVDSSNLNTNPSKPLQTIPNSSNSSTHSSSSSTRKHRGTSPDDGMFGFDYYDDEEDAYHMERNQSDPYPNERDW